MKQILFSIMGMLWGVIGFGYTPNLEVASGLNTPMGLLIDAEGQLWVVDSGLGGDDMHIETLDINTQEPTVARYGLSSRVMRLNNNSSLDTLALLPSIVVGMETVGGARLAFANGELYATSGFWVEHAGLDAAPLMGTLVRINGEEVSLVSDIWAYEKEHNPDGFVLESHPYGLAAGPDGMLYVADAGANSLFRIDPVTGDIEVLAVFEGVVSPLPNPARANALESDPVPTAVVVAEDGTIYVALLPGFPFLPGSAKVVRLSPEGELSDYATGLTSITDMQMGPDGRLYIVQLAEFGETGPQPATGALLRLSEGLAEVVLADIMFPTALAFNASGDAYLTVSALGPPGSGKVMLFPGVAQ